MHAVHMLDQQEGTELSVNGNVSTEKSACLFEAFICTDKPEQYGSSERPKQAVLRKGDNIDLTEQMTLKHCVMCCYI